MNYYELDDKNISIVTEYIKGETLDNIKLLEDLPNKKKVSATIFKEHFDLDKIVNDIKFLEFDETKQNLKIFFLHLNLVH